MPQTSDSKTLFTAPAPIQFEASAENQPRSFDGVAYSGGVMFHPMFPEGVVVDCASAQFEKLPAPAFVEHEHRERAGVISNAEISGNDIRIKGRLMPNTFGQQVANEADAGFPWQMSLGVYRSKKQRVESGESVEVNGRKFTGPLSVLRNARIRETSFCALGADGQTSATVFNDQPTNEVPQMDQAEHDRIVAELKAAHTTELAAANAARDAEKARADGAEQKFTALQTEVGTERKERRTGEVKALFAATGKEFSDAAAQPYLDMPEASFQAAAADIRKGNGRRADSHLFTADANGSSTAAPNVNDTEAIFAAATTYEKEQKALGRSPRWADCVAHVAGTAQAAA